MSAALTALLIVGMSVGFTSFIAALCVLATGLIDELSTCGSWSIDHKHSKHPRLSYAWSVLWRSAGILVLLWLGIFTLIVVCG